MTSAAFTKDHLPYPPIPFIEMVSTNNPKVPWADMEKWSFRVNREIALSTRNKAPTNQYACINSFSEIDLATS